MSSDPRSSDPDSRLACHPAPAIRDGVMLLLADGRFPSGGHAHSNGFEAADRLAGLDSPEAIERYARNRLATGGLADAALAAAVVDRIRRGSVDWAEVDAEVEARLTVPALRVRSRTLGRQWLRAGSRVWSSPTFDHLRSAGPAGPHEIPAFAAVARAAGLDAGRAAMVNLHHLVAGITTAAIRLRGLDPFALQAVQVRLLPVIDGLATRAERLAREPLSALPGGAAPLFEILAEDHATWDHRLFQS